MKRYILKCITCSKSIKAESSSQSSFCSIRCKLDSLKKNIAKNDDQYGLLAKKRSKKEAKILFSKPLKPKTFKQNYRGSKKARLKRRIMELEGEVAKLKRTQKIVAQKEVEKTGFYWSREWRSLRYRAIKTFGRKCHACGATSRDIHVDHIKPRSKYPELELEFTNLQILCPPCNLGKSNTDETDWRFK